MYVCELLHMFAKKLSMIMKTVIDAPSRNLEWINFWEQSS